MRELIISDLDIVAGGDANSCAAAILGAGGMGGFAGGLMGTGFGPAGMIIGGGLGALAAGAYAAANNPACSPSGSTPPQNTAGIDGDESYA